MEQLRLSMMRNVITLSGDKMWSILSIVTTGISR